MILLLTLLASATPGHALIVTNNRSSTLGLPDLRYADDDGAQYAELFSELLGKDNVELLTTFDAESRRLFPNQIAEAPTRANLMAAAAHFADAEGDLYLVLVGHGDVAASGGGFIELEDGKLTSADLDAILDRLPHAQVHLILDSCNSYFMLNPRKPGGTRFVATGDSDRSLLARHPHLGALLSTSAESVTYEWSELQSGIFSYLVRSGLRGGADADSDGVVTYQELAAFVQVATQAIPNDLYRPKLFMHGPSGAAAHAFASFSGAQGRHLQVAAAGERRLTIRDAMGVRVLDVRKQDGTALDLLLPTGALEVQEALATSFKTRAFTATNAQLDDLPEEKTPIATRGESPVFQHLFERPFGASAYAAAATQPSDEPAYGVSVEDVMRLRAHLGTAAAMGKHSRYESGTLFGALAVGSTALTAAIATTHPKDGDSTRALQITLAAGAAVGFGIGSLIEFIKPSTEERFAQQLEQEDFSSEKSRAELFLRYENDWRHRVAAVHTHRLILGGIFTAIGASSVGASLGFMIADQRRVSWGTDAVYLADGVAFLAAGVVQLVVKHPYEITWDAYQSETGAMPHKITLTPTIGASDTNKTALVGLGGTF